MSVFRRFSNIFQQKSSAALDRLEDPSQAIDLSYQQLLEQQQRLRTALVEATSGQKRLENQAAEMDKRIAQLNGAAQQAMQSGKEDLATQALTQAEVLGQQRQQLNPQIQSIAAQVAKLQQGIQRYQARVQAFASQRETLKASYEASKATSAAGDTLAGIGEHTSDTAMMMQRAQDKIARSQAHADAVDSLLDSGVLDAPLLSGGGTALDDQITATVVESNVQAKLAAMKAQLGLAAPAVSAALPEGSIVVRIHGEEQYRIATSARLHLDTYDQRLVAAVRSGDDAAFHSALADATAFVKSTGTQLSHEDLSTSDIILPSADMSLDEVKTLLQQENLLGEPA
ncbi:MAG: PspA/IM30 family protein [Candidatus Dormibacteraeota bacterium]|uniref:Phage shock protein A n=1 Tax=Candidatus Aeolococcus gillhamiae TaxID=3127015 RepID=A0A2W6AHN1_9BACT|nr:PspA/IM30 family protein [Candidatus Dormibacteraeota bacterium]PZR83064.1 MAG: phage shock protein A [Candidatus Dormibacter sp. RRmetagenome_bin12]